MNQGRIHSMPVSRVHPAYVAKLERKGRTREELDQVIRWLTGYAQEDLEDHLRKGTGIAGFFREAPAPNPLRDRIRGVVCGVRVEEVEDPVLREVRRLDKLVDDLAKGKPMEKVLPR